jgi:hypothetical protein
VRALSEDLTPQGASLLGMHAGGGYHVFAGREVARALGRMAIDEAHCTADTADFTAREEKVCACAERSYCVCACVGYGVGRHLLHYRARA